MVEKTHPLPHINLEKSASLFARSPNEVLALNLENASCAAHSWQSIVRRNITSLHELQHILELPDETVSSLLLASPKFKINIPRRLVDKMAKKTIFDPLFRQFVPLVEELVQQPEYFTEPVQDQIFKKSGRVVQKYARRALIITTGACAMNCRFCFRQNYPYTNTHSSSQIPDHMFDRDIAYLKTHSDISEVILSGGDPLSLGDTQLKKIIDSIDTIPHIERIRFHTRFPIGIPERITQDFLRILAACSKQLFFVLHVNHPHELDNDILYKISTIQKLGIPVLSQSVLLRGVNDCVTTLESLFTLLGKHGIIPYYLHQLDKVQGAHHFNVSYEEGKSFIIELQKRLSGYLVPKYVQEIPNETSKTVLV